MSSLVGTPFHDRRRYSGRAAIPKTKRSGPDFFVPPVIGPWYLKRTLRRGGGEAIDRIERLAQAVEELEQGA